MRESKVNHGRTLVMDRLSHASLLWIAVVVASIYGVTAPLAQTFTPIRINVGGSAYTDGQGNQWSADTGYNTGVAYATGAAVSGTSDPVLFQRARWNGSSTPELEYTFSVPNGVYEVRLLFAETWSGAYAVGVRRFGIQLENSVPFPDVDIYAEAGPSAALSKTATVAVADGVLNVRLLHVVEHPVLYAIEVTSSTKPTAPTGVSVASRSTSQIDLSWQASIGTAAIAGYEVERCEGAACTNFVLIAAPNGTSYQDSGLPVSTTYRYRIRAIDLTGSYSSYSAIKTAATQGASTPQPIRINVGGGSYTDSGSNVWSADTGFNGGSTGTASVAIAGTADPALYQSQRWVEPWQLPLEYALTVQPGSYQVRIHLAELWSGAFFTGRRVFHVQIEGNTAIPNIDVFAEAGANAALVKTATAAVSDGQLNIRFAHSIHSPSIAAIEVLWLTPADGAAPSAPTGLSAVPTSAVAIALGWSASTDDVGVAGYKIERCAGVGCSNFAEAATTSATSHTDIGLSPHTAYRYRVRSFDDGGNYSAYSSIATASTSSPSTEYVYDELGRLALVATAGGGSIVYSYDESGNVTAIVRTAP